MGFFQSMEAVMVAALMGELVAASVETEPASPVVNTAADLSRVCNGSAAEEGLHWARLLSGAAGGLNWGSGLPAGQAEDWFTFWTAGDVGWA